MQIKKPHHYVIPCLCLIVASCKTPVSNEVIKDLQDIKQDHMSLDVGVVKNINMHMYQKDTFKILINLMR